MKGWQTTLVGAAAAALTAASKNGDDASTVNTVAIVAGVGAAFWGGAWVLKTVVELLKTVAILGQKLDNHIGESTKFYRRHEREPHTRLDVSHAEATGRPVAYPRATHGGR